MKQKQRLLIYPHPEHFCASRSRVFYANADGQDRNSFPTEKRAKYVLLITRIWKCRVVCKARLELNFPQWFPVQLKICGLTVSTFSYIFFFTCILPLLSYSRRIEWTNSAVFHCIIIVSFWFSTQFRDQFFHFLLFILFHFPNIYKSNHFIAGEIILSNFRGKSIFAFIQKEKNWTRVRVPLGSSHSRVFILFINHHVYFLLILSVSLRKTISAARKWSNKTKITKWAKANEQIVCKFVYTLGRRNFKNKVLRYIRASVATHRIFLRNYLLSCRFR